jgi:hypothetical protein
MADTGPSKPASTGMGCVFAIGFLFFIFLTLVALLSTHITSVLTQPNDAAGFAVITAVLWAMWLGVLILLVRALKKMN